MREGRGNYRFPPFVPSATHKFGAPVGAASAAGERRLPVPAPRVGILESIHQQQVVCSRLCEHHVRREKCHSL